MVHGSGSSLHPSQPPLHKTGDPRSGARQGLLSVPEQADPLPPQADEQGLSGPMRGMGVACFVLSHSAEGGCLSY